MEIFATDARKVFSDEEYEDLISFLAEHPDAGEVIQGTGGIRKVRWRARGRGKRGGARVIYYFRDLNLPVYLLAVYAKGEKIDLTERDKKQMRAMVEEIVQSTLTRRLRVITRA